jgi:hypothetical protein
VRPGGKDNLAGGIFGHLAFSPFFRKIKYYALNPAAAFREDREQ